MEYWKKLKCYDRKTWEPINLGDKYSISSYGRVRNEYTGEFVSPQLTGIPAYYYVNLQPVNGKRKLVRVHLAMAYSFYGLPKDKNYTCDHIDQNKYNNSLSNLRWASKLTQTSNKTNTICVDNTPLPLLMDADGYHIETDKGYIRAQVAGGATYEEATINLAKYKYRGGSYTKTITLEDGSIVDLWDWCQENNITYPKAGLYLRSGWTLFQITNNIPPYKSEDVYEVNGLCFPSRELLLEHLGMKNKTYLRLIKDGYSLEDIVRYDAKDKDRFSFQGYFMTKEEHCKRLGTSVNRVNTMMNKHKLPFEDAILLGVQRIIKHTINGVTKRNSEWARQYDIPNTCFNSYLTRHKCFRGTLEHYGIDTSNMEITPFI